MEFRFKKCTAINKEKPFKNVKTAGFRDENWRFWSGLRDLNPRSPGPKPGAIPNFAKPGYSVEDFAVVVKYVVKGILPHFQETFKSGYWGKLGRNRGAYNISGSRTGLVFQLPNHALYHLSYTRLFHSSGGAYSLDTRLPPGCGESCRTRRPSSRGVGLYRKKRLSLYTLPGKKARKRIISSLRN